MPFRLTRSLLVLYFVFFIPLFLFAQQAYTISGVVKDATNGETLLGATVFLKGTTIGSTTNSYGFFSITADEAHYTLVVSTLSKLFLDKKFL
ncbi:MAG: carboxypeptidase-like regulatory domain-containing protein [Flavobacteriaceae bacterium]